MNLRQFFERYGVSLGVLSVLALLIALVPGNSTNTGNQVTTSGTGGSGTAAAGTGAAATGSAGTAAGEGTAAGGASGDGTAIALV